MAQEQDHAPKQFALYFSHMEQPDRYNDRGADLGPPTTGLLMVCIAWDRGSHGIAELFYIGSKQRKNALTRGKTFMFEQRFISHVHL